VFTCDDCLVALDDALKVKKSRLCKPCHNARCRAYHAEHREEIIARQRVNYSERGDVYNANRRRKYATDPDFAEAHKTSSREWGRKNAAHVVARTMKTHKRRMAEDAEYAARRRAKTRECVNFRRAIKSAVVSKYFREELAKIYSQCPSGFEVDHIHPLSGKNFSGLHVPWNLQYLPISENRRKGNRVSSEELVLELH